MATEISPCPANGAGKIRRAAQRPPFGGREESRLSVRLSPHYSKISQRNKGRVCFERRETGTVSFLTPVWSYVDALVHPTAQQDALTAARHRAFIAPRLFGSFAALGSLPVYIALRGVPSALEVGVFAWLVAPILIVLLPVAHRPLRDARTSVIAGADRTCRRSVAWWYRRHRFIRRDLAGDRAARSGAVGLAPRGPAGGDLCARRPPACCWLRRARPAAAAVPTPEQRMRAGRARHHLGGALRRRPCARRRAARAHRLLACFMPRRTATACWPAT